MKSFSFQKYSGAGNDFVLIDRQKNPDFELKKQDIPLICDRRDGIGADGVLIFYELTSKDFGLDYYNADGSTGMLCANGSRCAILYAELSGKLNNGKAQFISNGVSYSGEVVKEGIIKLNLGSPKDLKTDSVLSLGDKDIPYHYLNTGSPHVVINIDELKSEFNSIEDIPVEQLGSLIRKSEVFQPLGTNVNFMELRDGIRIRTFEKGVEAETAASGTGTVASGIIAYLKYGLEPPIKIITGGGTEMTVDFSEYGSEIKNVSLTGPVKFVFEGEYFI